MPPLPRLQAPSPCCPISQGVPTGLRPCLCSPSLAVLLGPTHVRRSLSLGGRCIAGVSQYCPPLLCKALFLWPHSPRRWGGSGRRGGAITGLFAGLKVCKGKRTPNHTGRGGRIGGATSVARLLRHLSSAPGSWKRRGQRGNKI